MNKLKVVLEETDDLPINQTHHKPNKKELIECVIAHILRGDVPGPYMKDMKEALGLTADKVGELRAELSLRPSSGIIAVLDYIAQIINDASIPLDQSNMASKGALRPKKGHSWSPPKTIDVMWQVIGKVPAKYLIPNDEAIGGDILNGKLKQAKWLKIEEKA